MTFDNVAEFFCAGMSNSKCGLYLECKISSFVPNLKKLLMRHIIVEFVESLYAEETTHTILLY